MIEKSTQTKDKLKNPEDCMHRTACMFLATRIPKRNINQCTPEVVMNKNVTSHMPLRDGHDQIEGQINDSLRFGTGWFGYLRNIRKADPEDVHHKEKRNKTAGSANITFNKAICSEGASSSCTGDEKHYCTHSIRIHGSLKRNPHGCNKL